MVSNKNYRYFVTTVYLSNFDDLNRQFILLPTWLVYRTTIVFLDKYTRLLRQKFIKTNQSSDIIQKYFLNLFEKCVCLPLFRVQRGVGLRVHKDPVIYLHRWIVDNDSEKQTLSPCDLAFLMFEKLQFHWLARLKRGSNKEWRATAKSACSVTRLSAWC